MKRLKTICNSMLVLFTCVLLYGLNVNAADNLYFDDPTTAVGEQITIRVFLSADEDVSESSGVLTYDSAALEFVSGESATLSEAGKIAIKSDSGVAKPEYNLTFRALKAGTTKIEVESYTAEGLNGNLDPILGDSTITINAGANGETEVEATGETAGDTAAPTGDAPTIDFDGVTYQIAQDFTEAEIPDTFTETEMNYEGVTIKAVAQEASGQNLIYLQSPEGEKSFFVYDSDKGTVGYLEQIYVTNDYYIILLNNEDKVSLPSYYSKTTLTVNNHEFPAWQNTESSDYYVVYALSSEGTKGMYTYDSKEQTYQRMVPVKEAEAAADDSSSGGILGKIADFVNSHTLIAVILIGVLLLFFLIVLIVVAIKLRHRNIELDDLYDEYGIDSEDGDGEGGSENEEDNDADEKKSNRRKYEEDELETLDDDFDFEDDFDEGYDEYDDDDDTGVINLDDDDTSNTDTLNLIDDDDDDDMIIDDLDSFIEEEEEPIEPVSNNSKPSKKQSKKVAEKFSDTDFIDLD